MTVTSAGTRPARTVLMPPPITKIAGEGFFRKSGGEESIGTIQIGVSERLAGRNDRWRPLADVLRSALRIEHWI
jgi:hypothetical protein